MNNYCFLITYADGDSGYQFVSAPNAFVAYQILLDQIRDLEKVKNISKKY